MMAIYECRPSLEDDRPQIDFELPENCRNDWLAVGEVVDGTRPRSQFPRVVIRVVHPEATKWDCFMDGGVRGLYSNRFLDVVGAGALRGLVPLPATLNGESYYFLRYEQPVDCLDLARSELVYFRSNPTHVKSILHYAFDPARVPADACFCLPEVPYLLLTEAVADRIRHAGLRGVRLIPLG